MSLESFIADASKLASQFSAQAMMIASVPADQYARVLNLRTTHGVEGVHVPQQINVDLATGAARAINNMVIEATTRGSLPTSGDAAMLSAMHTRYPSIVSEAERLTAGLLYLGGMYAGTAQAVSIKRNDTLQRLDNASRTIALPKTPLQVAANVPGEAVNVVKDWWNGVKETFDKLAGWGQVAIVGGIALGAYVVFRR